MMPLDTIDWANSNEDDYRKWRDKNVAKPFWFVIRNVHTGKMMRKQSYGPTIDLARDNLRLPDGEWEII